MAFWVSYDHLGKLLLANLITMFCLLIPGYFALISFYGMAFIWSGIFALLTTGVLAPIFAAGMAHMTIELIETRDGSIWAFFVGMRRYAGRAVRLGLLCSTAGLFLATSVWFYAVRMPQQVAWAGYVLSALALWALLFLGLAFPLAGPALVHKGTGAIATLKLSTLLVLDNPLFCLGLAVYAIVWGFISLLPPVLMLFSMAPLVVLFCAAYEMLSRKYSVQENDTCPGESTRRVPKDEEDDYLNRGFRDFLFPWKD